MLMFDFLPVMSASKIYDTGLEYTQSLPNISQYTTTIHSQLMLRTAQRLRE